MPMSSTKTFSRRGFLCLSASTLGAGVAVQSAASAQGVTGANDTLRLGLIGAGARGTVLLDEVLQIGASGGKVRVVAVSDLFEPRLAQATLRCGGEGVLEWERLVERQDIDAIVIATPHHWHAPMTLAALQSGKDVYCEAPMALTVAEAKAVRDAAAATRRVVQIGTQETSEDQWRAAREAVTAVAIGAVVWSQGNCHPRPAQAASFSNATLTQLHAAWPRFSRNPQAQLFEPNRLNHWRSYWDYSLGAAAEEHYRKLAPLLMAIGPDFPVRVSAAGGVYADDGCETPDALMMTAEYPSGHSIVLASSQAARRAAPAVIRGERGTIYCEGAGIRVVQGDGMSERFNADGLPTHPADSTAAHLQNWLDCVRSREQCVCDEELGYRTMAAIGMASDAYRYGTTLARDAENTTCRLSAPRMV
jgi:predicted dehydrogenase